MDTIQAFGMAEANKGREQMVFDWDKAAQIIRDRNPTEASAGLSGDWEWTGGKIFAEGKPVPPKHTYTYLSSNWATPELNIDGEIIACYRMESETPGWNSGTYWPESAIAILNAANTQGQIEERSDTDGDEQEK